MPPIRYPSCQRIGVTATAGQHGARTQMSRDLLDAPLTSADVSEGLAAFAGTRVPHGPAR